jgi:DNA replication and repair protein RecF
MLTSLRLHQFRCYASLSLALEGRLTVFEGSNGEGKTSILEAVCVLLRLQSPRCSGLRDLTQFGTSASGVAGTLGGRELRHRFSPAGRALAVDGAEVTKPRDYLAASGLVVWMGNGDLALVTGPAEERRRYLDFLGTQLLPEYAPALRAYERTVRARNLLLKRDREPPWREIGAFLPLLVEHGRKLTDCRRAVCVLLAPLLTESYAIISGAREVLAGAYVPDMMEDYPAQLAALREDETRRRITLAGPHRDDMALTLGGRPAARFASEGQLRSIALALKLAQATVLRREAERPPVLLIDDIFGELDPTRRRALFAALPGDAQKLVTATSLARVLDDCGDAQRFVVAQGQVAPL